MRTLIRMAVFIFIIFMTGCSNNGNAVSPSTDKVELMISAAASLKDSLEEIKENYEQHQPNVTLRFNYGSSGSLQQQILQGAPVDLFLSAAEDKFTKLVDEQMISEKDGTSLLSNELVLITSKDNPHNISSFEDLLHHKIEHISIGIPDTVPAGKYAKESLESQNLWNKLESRIVYAKDVRQVLAYVETGNVAAGIVYKTDAFISDKVKVIVPADTNTHSPLSYYLGIIKDSANYEEARDFYHYLQSNEALEVFKDYGFITN